MGWRFNVQPCCHQPVPTVSLPWMTWLVSWVPSQQLQGPRHGWVRRLAAGGGEAGADGCCRPLCSSYQAGPCSKPPGSAARGTVHALPAPCRCDREQART